MIKKFPRLFKEYRDLEKDLERETALVDSMKRYINALEGRDKERLAQIEELEAKNREALTTIGYMRTHIAGLCPDREEEKP